MSNQKRNDEEVIIIRANSDKDLKMVTTVVYVLQAIGIFVGFTFIAGIIINYLKRKDVMGTWLATHFLWQIRTFWYGLLWAIIGTLFALILVGYAILFINFVWMIYRIVKGWMALSENRAMYTNY